MFSYYPRPQSYYQPSPYYHQPSPYARTLAQQQDQQRARAIAQEMERQRAARSRYFPDGYDYEPESDEEDYYMTPRQRDFLEARRRQEALEQRKQEAARMFHERQQQARAAEKQSTPPPQSPSRRNVSPSPAERTKSPSAPHTPQPASSPSPELLNEAATKIQTQYRIHRSLRTIAELAAKFESLKASFVPPTTVDFQGGDGSIVSVPVPSTPVPAPAESAKLAFTPTNVPLHTYAEFLSRLLVSLDAVESRGDRGVRERRRAVARLIEGEAARVEEFWRGVWAAHQEQQQQRQQRQQQQVDEEEVCAMVVDEAPAEAELPELAAPESDSDVEPELATPPATPAELPKIILSPESESESAEEDGVVVDKVVPEEEKVSGEDFVVV